MSESTRTILNVETGVAWREVYSDLRLTERLMDSCGMAASSEFFASPLAAGDGKHIGLIGLSKTIRNPAIIKLSGHLSAVQDLAFSPFSSRILASAADDSTVKIWDVSDQNSDTGGEVRQCVVDLVYHKRKVIAIDWSRTVECLIASASHDRSICCWDIEKGDVIFEGELPEAPYQCQWNYYGTLIGAPCKDKSLNIFDPRTKSVVASICVQEVSKAIKFKFLDGHPSFESNILTTGMAKSLERQLKFWDTRMLDKPVSSIEFDGSSSQFFPHYDESLGLLYLVAKGEATVRCFQILNDLSLNLLDENRTPEAAKSFCFIPKTAVDVMRCEVNRLLKNVDSKHVTIVSFVIPRKVMDVFYEDIFPSILAPEPSITREQWMNGEPVVPKMVSQNPELKNQGLVQKGRKLTIKSTFGELENLKVQLAEATEKINNLQISNNELKSEVERANETINQLRLENSRISELEAAISNLADSCKDASIN